MPGIPKNQFSRPSINLGGAKKSWQQIPAGKVNAGDLIQGPGLVIDRQIQQPDRVLLMMASGKTIIADISEEVTAFHAVSHE